MRDEAGFLTLSPERRALAFEQAATKRQLHSVIVEKDFWVSWLLKLLFSHPGIGPQLVFKGGTSLSKVFGVIRRFSEDIDLSVAPEFVGFTSDDVPALVSRTKRDAAMRELQHLCGLKVQTVVWPAVEEAIREELGAPGDGTDWTQYVFETSVGSPVLHFRYPQVRSSFLPYIRNEVKLELGSLTEQRPTGQYGVRPWIADDFPALFASWECQVTALELGRTFWEKATILHAEHFRPAEQVTPARYSRHYSDMSRLLQHADAASFLEDKEACLRVANWKSRTFSRAWARYDLARHGTFRLAPEQSRVGDLAIDYADMRPMFLDTPEPFEEVLERLRVAEEAMNKA